MNDMTYRQSWAIFTMGGYDVRDTELSMDEASDIIGLLKDGELEKAIAILETVPGAKKKADKKPKRDWQELFDKADKAGREAAENHKPVPMTVQERANPLDDSSPVIKEYGPYADGVCGFAWVTFRPATNAFCKWLKKNDLARPAYYGGYEMWIYDYNQSMEKKYAYAAAFAKVINDEIGDDKFHASPGSRMD